MKLPAVINICSEFHVLDILVGKHWNLFLSVPCTVLFCTSSASTFSIGNMTNLFVGQFFFFFISCNPAVVNSLRNVFSLYPGRFVVKVGSVEDHISTTYLTLTHTQELRICLQCISKGSEKMLHADFRSKVSSWGRTFFLEPSKICYKFWLGTTRERKYPFTELNISSESLLG